MAHRKAKRRLIGTIRPTFAAKLQSNHSGRDDSLPSDLEAFHAFARTGVEEIALYSERDDGRSDTTLVRISAINENSIMLFAPSGDAHEVIDRSASSSYFDSLGD